MAEEQKEEKHGVKESKEVLIGANEVSLVLVRLLKDGFQAGNDLSALVGELVSNEELKKALADAMDKIGKVDDELKDLSLSEGGELAMVQLGYVEEIIDAFKK